MGIQSEAFDVVSMDLRQAFDSVFSQFGRGGRLPRLEKFLRFCSSRCLAVSEAALEPVVFGAQLGEEEEDVFGVVIGVGWGSVPREQAPDRMLGTRSDFEGPSSCAKFQLPRGFHTKSKMFKNILCLSPIALGFASSADVLCIRHWCNESY